jgi:D-alanine transaminase
MPELAYINGEILPVEKAMVPIEDRGYQFGDAVYEVIASYKGAMFGFDDHIDRLMGSMRALNFPEVPRETFCRAVQDLFVKAGIPRAALYIQVSRGTAPRYHGYPADSPIQFIMTIREIKDMPAKQREDGISAITVKDFRWGRCDIKTTQLLPNVMVKQKALDSDAYDAIFVADDNIVREATSSNVFIVKNGVLKTHPLTLSILPGISRKEVLDLCKEFHLVVEETVFNVDTLYDADEVFLTGTITEVLPVIKIDGRKIGAGSVGPIASKLYKALQAKINP